SLHPPRPTLFPYTTLFRSLVATFGRRFVHRAKISNAPQAIADVKYTDLKPIDEEIAHFKKYASGAFAEQFMTAPSPGIVATTLRSEEHTSELQSRFDLVCR